MAGRCIHKKEFEEVGALGLRAKGAYAGTVTEEGALVSDRYVLFNGHFVRKEARATAEALREQVDGDRRVCQDEARDRLNAARERAQYAGELLGHVEAGPAVRVKPDRIAGIRYQEKKRGRWRYVWVDAYRLRLLSELFKQPVSLFCAAWDEPVVLKRGSRTVGCIMPASPYVLDIEVRR